MEQAVAEMSHYAEYDYLIVNDDFDAALSDLKTILRAERLRMSRQKQRHDALITNCWQTEPTFSIMPSHFFTCGAF